MKGRKRHGGRRANRGTRPVTGEAERRKRRTRDRKAWRQVNRLLRLWDFGRAIVLPSAPFEHTVYSPILARYAREITAAKTRGLTLTVERIEAERDAYLERGE